MQLNSRALRVAVAGLQGQCRANDQVLLVRRYLWIGARKRYVTAVRYFKIEIVMERDCLQYCFYFVIAVGSPAEDLQTPVYLGK